MQKPHNLRVNKFVAGVLILAAIIHVLPSVGVMGAGALARLYGIVVTNPTALVLLQHRAILFGIVGVGLFAAARRSEMQPFGLVVALVSTLAFIAFAWTSGDQPQEIDRVAWVDAALAPLLVAALVVRVRSGASVAHLASVGETTPPR